MGVLAPRSFAPSAGLRNSKAVPTVVVGGVGAVVPPVPPLGTVYQQRIIDRRGGRQGRGGGVLAKN